MSMTDANKRRGISSPIWATPWMGSARSWTHPFERVEPDNVGSMAILAAANPRP
jgi:hypothetical protein